MGRVKKGGFIFEIFKTDHKPFHVHVVKDKKLIAKINLETFEFMKGKYNRKLLKLLDEIIKEGRIQWNILSLKR